MLRKYHPARGEEILMQAGSQMQKLPRYARDGVLTVLTRAT